MSAVYSRSAVLSEDQLYRYRLHRRWNDSPSVVVFCMLNPSTADARADDPTIRRCIRYAQGWGHGALTVVNLFAYRAKNPGWLLETRDPVGPGNDGHVVDTCRSADQVVLGWGNGPHGAEGAALLRARSAVVLGLLRDAGVRPQALTVTGEGQPGHPLFLKGDLVPVEYTP